MYAIKVPEHAIWGSDMANGALGLLAFALLAALIVYVGFGGGLS
ncbi:hypothetical protein [Tropicimonas sp. S265A]